MLRFTILIYIKFFVISTEKDELQIGRNQDIHCSKRLPITTVILIACIAGIPLVMIKTPQHIIIPP